MTTLILALMLAAPQAVEPVKPPPVVPRPAAPPQDKAQELEKKVAELERRVAALEAAAKQAAAARPEPRLAECARHLEKLWKVQAIYQVQFGGRAKSLPADTGSAFWTKGMRTTPALVDPTAYDWFVCPASAEKPRDGFTTYLGPRKDANTLAEGDVVGCCRCHEGAIVVVLKTGEVKTVTPRDPLYDKAIAATVDDPGLEGKREACRVLLKNLSLALRLYELDHAAYPDALAQGLQTRGPKKLPYFEFTPDLLNDKGEALDVWGKPLVYKKVRDGFVLYSVGPNGKDEDGQGDDVK
jgi:hypothetical protein